MLGPVPNTSLLTSVSRAVTISGDAVWRCARNADGSGAGRAVAGAASAGMGSGLTGGASTGSAVAATATGGSAAPGFGSRSGSMAGFCAGSSLITATAALEELRARVAELERRLGSPQR